mgnify:CR=1 FL=1|tara:strand:- start:5558 stop:6418 length:861 start_codon:yes stop_codon:yes gene_type:complete
MLNRNDQQYEQKYVKYKKKYLDLKEDMEIEDAYQILMGGLGIPKILKKKSNPGFDNGATCKKNNECASKTCKKIHNEDTTKQCVIYQNKLTRISKALHTAHSKIKQTAHSLSTAAKHLGSDAGKKIKESAMAANESLKKAGKATLEASYGIKHMDAIKKIHSHLSNAHNYVKKGLKHLGEHIAKGTKVLKKIGDATCITKLVKNIHSTAIKTYNAGKNAIENGSQQLNDHVKSMHEDWNKGKQIAYDHEVIHDSNNEDHSGKDHSDKDHSDEDHPGKDHSDEDHSD